MMATGISPEPEFALLSARQMVHGNTVHETWVRRKRSEGQKGAEVVVAKRGQAAVRS